MALFKRRDEKDEEYEEDPSNAYASTYARASVDRSEDKGRRSRRRFGDRDFKDLKPENKKKRKEPKKPWGRKERLFVLIVLLLTVGTSAILAMSSRSWKLPGLPRFKIPTVRIPFLQEETIVIEGRKKDYEQSLKVIESFKEKTESLSGVYGLYVIDLESGFSYGVNESETFQAASLIKLPVIAAMYLEAEEGTLDLDSKYRLKNSDKVSGAGTLSGKPAGYEITFANLINLMGKQSDNTAFAISMNLLGDAKINDVIKAIGMANTSLDENETTPKDIGIFFEELWYGNIVSQENRDKILDSLTETSFEEWLVAGIPGGTRLAHKYGREVHVVNDAGVVFAEELSEPGGSPSRRPFVVVIMSKGVIENEADEIFPELARIVYDGQTKSD
ncbi:hypothetical protein A2714_02945 [Candidatus Woesebacteria bacterium RIFCSPHIGHO2_01_FULL_38_9]|uniref:Beta-lactamase class A catalytic domain-containing protein n=2 Tax=Candidatus Woeseibacteriota TaxID=1752722 RepID=A0A1F7Y010_9BACT|nr:MAG: hypothetical protein A2714_02945 [Candidatus Woesebacteria bacterium RIFCSPHIGHO2_01_FULL_38_9]OGM58186.1 MAG: hypothetical protein A3A75_03805 [Candidatus Woesebacteria bacterium RIFCSPLOWO2_01_FULL_39_10]